MSLRDDLLPVAQLEQDLALSFGMSRFAVTIRRRTWSGAQQGQGTATDHDVAITPPPAVRDVTARDLTAAEAEYLASGTGKVVGAMYKIENITPQYAGGGYPSELLRLWPNRDTGNVENLIVLVGDDGYLRECVQVTFDQSDPFGYSMLAKEIDRPRTQLLSLAITPSPLSIAHGAQQQLVCTGTFSGGSTSILTVLTAWSSSAPSVATVDIYGNLTAVGAGTATLTATLDALVGTPATLAVTVT